MRMSRCAGGLRYRRCWMKMTDREIVKLTVPEILDLIRRLLEEIEIRAMQDAR